MFNDYYASLAQILPVLLLALVWDSAYLARIQSEHRVPRRVRHDGVRFWTKPRVRAYNLTVASIIVVSTAIAMLVLGGFLDDTRAMRVGLAVGLVLALASLLFRVTVDVFLATAAVPDSADERGQTTE